MKKIMIVCAVMALIATNAFADLIMFKSGKKIEGNVKAITNDTITVDIYGVTEMTYDLADIQEINGQVVDLKPSATSPSAPPAAPAGAVEEITTEVIEVAPAEMQPPAETTEVSPVTPEQEENISGFAAKETQEIKLTDKEVAGIMALFMAFFGILLVAAAVIYIYSAICLQIIAKKTDTQYGWLAWIPIANIFLMCNIGGVSYKWLLPILLIFVPVINVLGSLYSIFLTGYLWYMIAIARGKPGWIGILIFVPILGTFIVPGYLAFSKKEEGMVQPPNTGGGEPASPPGTAPAKSPLE